MLSAALARPGLRIFTAEDPEEGVELVFREHPQIVLTDLVMPGISGLEVLERIVEFNPAMGFCRSFLRTAPSRRLPGRPR